MKAAPFEYFRPASLEEAAERLSANADDGAMILAGGQSLVPMMALRVAYASELIDLNAIKGIDTILHTAEGITIHPLVRHADFHDASVAPGPLGAVLSTISRHIAHYPIRQRGTFCGSLAHADPSSEWCLVSAALDAKIELLSVSGRRSVAAADWWVGMMETARESTEIIAAVHLPLVSDDTCWGFYEFNRRAGDFALGMAFCSFRLTEGRITDARVAVGGIEEFPRRFVDAESVLDGAIPSPDIFAAAGRAVSEAATPLEDPATSASYRRDLAATVVQRALDAAIQSKSNPALLA